MRVRVTIAAYGAVEGRIQTLTTRRGLRFTLYDSLHDRAVSCHLREGQQETMRGLWDRCAVVQGRVSRDAITGRPIAIRNITKIEPRPEARTGSYLEAREASPLRPGDPMPEDTLRKIRDAW